MSATPDDGRPLVTAALAEPASRLVKEALGRLIAAEAMLAAMVGNVEPSDAETATASEVAADSA